MILAFFLLFVNDLFVLIAEGADVDTWRCENDSASELLQRIWEENRNLSSLFLDLDPETSKKPDQLEEDRDWDQCRKSYLNLTENPWKLGRQQSMQEVNKLIKSLSWRGVRHLKKKYKSLESKKFRVACTRKSKLYYLANQLSDCAGLPDVGKEEMEKFNFPGGTNREYMDFLKEILVAIDYWSARSYMCVKCRDSGVSRLYCEC